MKRYTLSLALAAIFLTCTLHAQVPQLINYQGRVAVGTVNFDGSGQFRFALVDAAGTTTYWSNDATSTAGSQPTAAVALTVTKGLYSVLLGDATLPGMTIVPATVFTNADVRLRVWFNDGTHGSQLLTPDQRIAAVGYALMAANAATVSDGAITWAKIASGAVGSAQLAAGAVQTANIAAGAVANTQLANSDLTVTAGSGLGGGGAVALGGSVTLSNAGVLSLTGGGGISVNTGTGAITLGSNATSANTASTIVLRDGGGSFSAGTISVAGRLTLPTTTSSTVGVITQNGVSLMHSFGGLNNFFAGPGAGNFIMTGGLNTAIGAFALDANMTGSQNTASGYAALTANTTGTSNTASGYLALQANTIGSNNSGSGYAALASNSTGTNNTASGYGALLNSTTASFNTANGTEALNFNRIGGNNTASGYRALFRNTTGNENTASGYGALVQNTTGVSNTATGANALSNTTGSNNIALGSGAGTLLTTGSNNIAIGHPGVAGEANTIRIGTTGTHSDTFLTGGIHGNATLSLSSFQPFLTLIDTNAGDASSRIQAAGGDLFLEPSSYIAGALSTGLVVKSGTGFVGIGTLAPIAKLHVEGNAAQALDKGGFVKAMAYINPYNPAADYVVRGYNSRLVGDAATTVPCGITVTREKAGLYHIDFGFDVRNRFFSITPDWGGFHHFVEAGPLGGTDPNVVLVKIFETEGFEDWPFCIIVF
jgi:hypothetical protein